MPRSAAQTRRCSGRFRRQGVERVQRAREIPGQGLRDSGGRGGLGQLDTAVVFAQAPMQVRFMVGEIQRAHDPPRVRDEQHAAHGRLDAAQEKPGRGGVHGAALASLKVRPV